MMENDDLIPVDKQEEIVVLPEGQYDCELKNIKIMPSKTAGWSDYIMFVFTIISGAHVGKPIFDYAPKAFKPGSKLWNKILILGSDPKAMIGGIKKSSLVGKHVGIMLGVDAVKGRNKVISTYPLTGSVSVPAVTEALKSKVVVTPSAPVAPPVNVKEVAVSAESIADLITF